ncbi:MAG: type III pantothenate kinase [Deltaproteobacteria bacterium]|jgi:type III pantothenate kinase|nr:type III pantothenate kinase [Deltaproteobacteria bacterium]MBT4269310.1 type III pantothenate kinase [Deltaproteobacteria bacterium]MBT4643252.1 type III pantothenate kinase [Deltaproteobacteria bacterium]MBT6498537.1 type III pantothenate kinase [Deltaproteobacteria bacterium]MBT6613220.1 type III pantothenate kinase [Deltaproteobacteria bacterium]
MILVIDIGNTNIVFGIYKEEALLHLWRMSTDKQKTSDEYLVTFFNLLKINEIDPKAIRCTILGSVVTPLNVVFQDLIFRLTEKPCKLVDLSCFPDMKVEMDNPLEVGADRLLNASAGFAKYGSAMVIIDFGTATTFDIISEKGSYLGGVIAPGLGLSLEALTLKAFKLPSIKLEKPPTVIGKNTVHAMQSGVVHGYAGMVDSMVEKISQELGLKPKVVATGGLATLIKPASSTIEDIVDDLTLLGLFMIAQKMDLQ